MVTTTIRIQSNSLYCITPAFDLVRSFPTTTPFHSSLVVAVVMSERGNPTVVDILAAAPPSPFTIHSTMVKAVMISKASTSIIITIRTDQRNEERACPVLWSSYFPLRIPFLRHLYHPSYPGRVGAWSVRSPILMTRVYVTMGVIKSEVSPMVEERSEKMMVDDGVQISKERARLLISPQEEEKEEENEGEEGKEVKKGKDFKEGLDPVPMFYHPAPMRLRHHLLHHQLLHYLVLGLVPVAVPVWMTMILQILALVRDLAHLLHR